MNKKGATNTVLWIVIALVVGYFLYTSGFLSGGVDTDSGSDLPPSDLQQTHTLSFKDELATTETTVNAGWYAFNGDGTYFDSGTASSGLDTVTFNIGEHYDVYAWTTGESGYLEKKVGIDVNNKARDATTIPLILRGGIDISATDDPIDLDQNISGTIGATEEVRVKWKVNVTNSASLAPVIVAETNNTAGEVDDVTMTKADSAGGTWTEINCPDRLSPSAANLKLYCFKRDKMAYASDGVIISYASIKFGDAEVGDESFIGFKAIDTAAYLKPGYDSIDDVIFAQENSADADIGAGDSVFLYTYFND